MIYFGHPTYLWLLLLPLVFGGLYLWYIQWYRKTRRSIGNYELIESMSRKASFKRRIYQGIAFTLGLALLCVTAAQPKWGRKDTKIQKEGVDLVFALDVSNSMRATDIKPSRFAAAKNQINRLVDELTGHRVGLVVFTAVSFVQSPLTSDYSAIDFYLEKLEPGQMPSGGTSFPDALRDAIELLTGKSSDDSDESPAEELDPADNQVIVLISDGEDHGTGLDSVLKKANKQDIRIATVGLGTREGAKIPVYGPNDQFQGYKQNNRGETIQSKLEVKRLKKIASETGGLYLEYNSETSISERLRSFINELRQTKFKSEKHRQYINRYLYFLIPGTLLLLIGAMLGSRRTEARTESLSQILKKFWPFALLILLTGCGDLFKEPVPSVEKGNQQLRDGEYEKALSHYGKTDKYDNRPPFQFNRGLAQMKLEDFEKARESFSVALGAADPILRFQALFQLGYTLAKEQKWKKSFDSFKQALKLSRKKSGVIPSKLIDKTQNNIEFVFRKVHPPCSELEDKLEPNNSIAEASTYKRKKAKKLTKCGGDPDWFKFAALEGSQITVRVELRKLRKKTFVAPPLVRVHKKPEVAIVDKQTGEPVATDNEPELTGESSARLELNHTLSDSNDRRTRKNLAVSIKSPQNVDYRYTLSVFVEPPCPEANDDNEPNDTRENATKLTKDKKKLYMCPGDTDWYKIAPELGDSVYLDLRPMKQTPKSSPPKLEAQIIHGEKNKKAHREGPYLTGGWSNLESEKDLYIKVTGQNKETKGPYRLKLYHYEPCMIGDDKYEPNDSFQEASPLKGKPKQRMFRYLRLCSQNKDFYRIRARKQKKKKKASLGPWGLSVVNRDGKETDVSFSMLNPRNGNKMGDEIPPSKIKKVKNRASISIDYLAKPPENQKQAGLKLSSNDQFLYHLVNLKSAQSKSKNKKSKKDKKKKNNKQNKRSKSQKDKQKSQKQKSQKQQQGQKNQKKKKRSGSRKNQDQQNSDKKKSASSQKKKSDKEKKKNKKRAASKSQKDQEKKKDPKQMKKSKKQKEIERLLESVRETDQNYQLQKQKQKQSGPSPSKDW